jgi:uncharacterized MAPEG superfamily protein
MTGIGALLGFTACTLALVVIVLVWRVVEVLHGKRVNSWGRGASIAVPSLVERASHAHLNALENLPVFAVLVLAAQILGKTGGVDTLGGWVLGARIAQSIVHLLGTSQPLVLIRATFYFTQLGLFAWLLWGLLT